jgi:V/A-type H+/Na+-transporting ATPase subunit D
MAKIKYTKTELKAQKDALRRFNRFLPMLQLKKQQLQAEIQNIGMAVAEKEAQELQARGGLARWVKMISEPAGLETLIEVEGVDRTEGNIAGVVIPVLAGVRMRRGGYDLFAAPTWLDDALDVIEQLTRLRIERETLEEQRRRIAEELRVTSQRVNLFEKVKIPECRENIRVIRIFLGDEQTASVARGKIAKRRVQDEAPASRAA